MTVEFRLQFSTGESISVRGDGLVGRDPRGEPAEKIGVLVAVHDPTRTVSKTHLEFGQADGVFWVMDRFSANGTAVVSADGERTRCEPWRRHPVERGGRVELGDQTFDVS